jgi:DnaJ-class molecular chaperone
MARTDHYVVLGVSRDETPERIRNAYHELVKRYHPDRGHAGDVSRFREVIEAYEVLSDTERRQRYNATLDREVRPTEPLGSRRWPEAEPLAAGDARLFAEPMTIRRDFRTIRPSLEELVARLRRSATGAGSPKGGHTEALHVEVLLGPQQAARGGLVDVAVPVARWCAECGGAGGVWYGRCVACDGMGVVEHDVPVRARLPSLTRDTTLELPLAELGLDDVVLALHVRVAWSMLG